jgi:hypothetical protein
LTPAPPKLRCANADPGFFLVTNAEKQFTFLSSWSQAEIGEGNKSTDKKFKAKPLRAKRLFQCVAVITESAYFMTNHFSKHKHTKMVLPLIVVPLFFSAR